MANFSVPNKLTLYIYICMYVEASAAPSGGREERAELRGERRLNPSSTYFQMLPASELKIVLGYELEPDLQQLV